MLTFTWNGLFRHSICVSVDGYGEPVTYRVPIWNLTENEYEPPAWMKQKIGDVDDTEWWAGEIYDDPTTEILKLF